MFTNIGNNVICLTQPIKNSKVGNHTCLNIGQRSGSESGRSSPFYNASEFNCTQKNKMSEGTAKM